MLCIQLFAQPSRKVAITVDDLPQAGEGISFPLSEQLTAKLLLHLTKVNAPAIGFVNEAQLFVPGQLDARTQLLCQWVQAGFTLGNHTYNHPSLSSTPLAEYETSILRGENVTRMLLTAHKDTLRYFRHPYLHTGPTAEIKAALADFLTAHQLAVAPVTMESSDYIFNKLYRNARDRHDTTTQQQLGAAYLAYTDTMITFWESMTDELFARPIAHVWLLHANALNADYLGALLKLLRQRGYEFISLQAALQDPAYRAAETYITRNGISWLHRWRYSKLGATRLNEEPEPPATILKAYQAVTAN